MKSAIACVKEAIKEVSDMLGIKITKVVACVPPTDCKMDIVVGSSDVLYTECVSGEDISNAISDALRGQNFDEYELVTATPISFKLDEQENIKDPKGMKGEVLETRVVISTLPKEGLYRILEVLKLSGIETVDIAFSSVVTLVLFVYVYGVLVLVTLGVPVSVSPFVAAESGNGIAGNIASAGTTVGHK